MKSKEFIWQQAIRIVIFIAFAGTTSCGGGGGDNSGPPPVPGSALDFQDSLESYSSIGSVYYTTSSEVTVGGEMNSARSPRGICADSAPPDTYTVEWRNEATGASGSSPIIFRCVTNYLFGVELQGQRSFFSVTISGLVLGPNRLVFDTYNNTNHIGRDSVTIVREDQNPPGVSFLYPADGSGDVATDHAVVVLFDEPMYASSLTSDRLVVTDETGGTVSGTLSYDADTFALSFRSVSPLLAFTPYTVSLSGAVEDEGGRNPLGVDLSWSFTTGGAVDAEAPAIDAWWPGTPCTCAPTSTRILAKASEILDPESLTAATMRLTDANGSTVAAGTHHRGTFIELTPASDLVAGMTYEVTVTAGVRDLAGNTISEDFSWQFTTNASEPVGRWSETSTDQPPPAMAYHTAVWTGREVIFWGFGGGKYDPVANQWLQATADDQRISPRRDHTAVWTGSEMIVWGGRNGALAASEILSNGGRYDPSVDSWLPVSAPAPSAGTWGHIAVWTGTQMIVWGGIGVTGSSTQPHTVATGWRYDPAADAFSAMTSTDAPSPRTQALAVWTGSEMIVWGGQDDEGQPLTDGARYDPDADTWTPLPPVDPPFPAGGPMSLVWTGTEAILWNGGRTASDQTHNDLFRQPTLRLFDPATNGWRSSVSGWEPFVATSSSTVASLADLGYVAHWSGDRMFVAGLYPNDGSYLYDPVLDRWQTAENTPGPTRLRGVASVRAGERLVFWGGVATLPSDRGFVFEP